MESIEDYRMSNGEIDADRAASENPHDDCLKKYKDISDGMDREWEIKGSHHHHN